MAHSHSDDDRPTEQPTDRSTDSTAEQSTPESTAEPPESEPTGSDSSGSGRRTFMKTVGAAAALTATGSLVGGVAAAEDLDTYLGQGGEVHIPAGEYSWDGSGLDIGSGDAIIGDGSRGDVVWNLESGTMDGTIGGRLENVVVSGANHESKSGIDLEPGATVDGFLWPDGGQRSEDRAFYTPDGGNDRLTIRNSGWAWMVNNGAYVDKPPVTMENCVSVNNNIAGIRVGHRDGTSSGQTTYIRNSLIAVTEDIPNDDTNSPNARGLRMRHPGNFVIENCWFIYLDVDGTADLIEIHDGAAGASVTIRDCAFYNDSDGDLVRDKSGGDVDVTIENCTVEGSGSRVVEPEYSGSGITEATADFPLPSQITGHPAADDIEGVGAGIGPWDSSGTTVTDPSLSNTLVLHASPDNADTAEVTFTVDGPMEFAADAESDVDSIVDNGDGTSTATSVLAPDELDSFGFDGSVVDYSVPSGATVDVSLNGTTTSFAELVGETDSTDDSTDSSGADVLEIVARQSGGMDYEFVVDGSAELHETSSMITSGNGDTVTDNGDGTVTVSGFTGNDGYGDAYLIDGTIQSFSWSPDGYAFDVLLNDELVDPLSFNSTDDGSSGDGSTDDGSSGDGSSGDGSTDDGSTDDGSSSTLPVHRCSIVGTNGKRATEYTFTVSGDVVRDPDASQVTADSTPWDRMEDIARDGKVIGIVGSGVDAYRFDGLVTEITVAGDATVNIERNV